MPIRVVLADDHPIVLQGLQQLFDRQPDLQVLKSCHDGTEAVDAVRTEKPDVLVLDMKMRDMSGLEVLRALARDRCGCRTVILTAALPEDEAVEAIALGATGIVLKESAPEAVLECVRRAAQGVQWIDKEALAGALDRVFRQRAAASTTGAILTPREIEVVRQVADGRRNKDIAERLAISEGTVKMHLHNIYEKVGVSGRLELVLYAQEKGLV